MLFAAPARVFDPSQPELVDRPETDGALLREELELLEKANRYLGGHRLMIQSLDRLFTPRPGTTLSILDLGTGLADIPRAIVGWLRQRGVAVTVVAVDRNPQVLEFARENCREWPEIRLEQHDLRNLPYARKSFDIVICSLALHHFTSAEAVDLLRRIKDLARQGYLVNDLRRNWLGIWLTELIARTVIRKGIIRQDAPQSCRAAFTVRELRAMAGAAGLEKIRISRQQAVFHMVLEGVE